MDAVHSLSSIEMKGVGWQTIHSIEKTLRKVW